MRRLQTTFAARRYASEVYAAYTSLSATSQFCSKTVQDSDSYRYYGKLIKTRMRSIEWRNFQ